MNIFSHFPVRPRTYWSRRRRNRHSIVRSAICPSIATTWPTHPEHGTRSTGQDAQRLHDRRSRRMGTAARHVAGTSGPQGQVRIRKGASEPVQGGARSAGIELHLGAGRARITVPPEPRHQPGSTPTRAAGRLSPLPFSWIRDRPPAFGSGLTSRSTPMPSHPTRARVSCDSPERIPRWPGSRPRSSTCCSLLSSFFCGGGCAVPRYALVRAEHREKWLHNRGG
jgi:hypothetical protein